MLQLSFNKRVHIWKPSFSIPNSCIKHLQYTIYMCHPYRITPWLIFSKCTLRLMSDTEPDKKHIIFFFFISGWITMTKSYRKPPRSLIHIGSTYFLFYSLFHFSFTGHRSENTVSHPNNSILIFPLNVSFLHGAPIKTVPYQSWHGWATWKCLSSLHLRLLLLSWLHTIFSKGTQCSLCCEQLVCRFSLTLSPAAISFDPCCRLCHTCLSKQM